MYVTPEFNPHGPDDPDVAKRAMRTIIVLLVVLVLLYLWASLAFPSCGPETANDTAGFCQRGQGDRGE